MDEYENGRPFGDESVNNSETEEKYVDSGIESTEEALVPELPTDEKLVPELPEEEPAEKIGEGASDSVEPITETIFEPESHINEPITESINDSSVGFNENAGEPVEAAAQVNTDAPKAGPAEVNSPAGGSYTSPGTAPGSGFSTGYRVPGSQNAGGYRYSGYGYQANTAPNAGNPIYNAAPGYNNYQGYNAPGYNAPGYNAPGYNAPGYNAPGYNAPGYNYQNPAQPGGYVQNQQPAEGKGTKKTGKIVFISIVAALLFVAFIAGVVVIVKHTRSLGSPTEENTNISTSSDENEKHIGSGNATIPMNPAKGGEKALTVEQIAVKARESCVGILVYYQKAYTSSEAGQGTGILAMEEGEYTYIITCAHVINDAGISVKVQLEDGTSYDNAEIVGVDTRTDVGVVRIKAKGLKLAEFGDSTQLRVGSSVYAVGNPGGIEFFGSFTDGIVSAIDRPIDSEIGYTMNCIQHTAAINPGNSGGALVNVLGQVIGVNSQKIASTEYEGMGFAIPINQAAKIAEDLINHGYVPDRAKLGITYYSLGASQQYSMIAQFNQLPAGTLIINQIAEDSSLYGTEARQYDMIIAVDGEELTTADVLLEKIDNGKVGDKHTLTLCRVDSNYQLNKFEVEIKLVEDKGDTVTEEEPTNYYPFFNFDF